MTVQPVERAEQRRQAVAFLRRAIAGALGVAKITVQRDLATGGPDDPPEPDPPEAPAEPTPAEPADPLVEPERIAGLDGKSYPGDVA